MAKRTTSRLELRKQTEAASPRGAAGDDASGKKKAKDPKKKAAPRPKRSKAKVVVRKRLIWGIFSSTMKEEGRFAYGDREAAEARMEELAAKYKRTYFIQPIKEPIPEAPVAVAEAE
jgi:hypothetical protein